MVLLFFKKLMVIIVIISVSIYLNITDLSGKLIFITFLICGEWIIGNKMLLAGTSMYLIFRVRFSMKCKIVF